MNKLNPVLQKQVEALAKICCDVLQREEVGVDEKASPLIEALVRNGFARQSNLNLQSRVEAEVVKRCPDIAGPHREELVGITRNFQTAFDRLVQWNTSTPPGSDAPKSANISSNTDS
jgi:hypothetical protein